MHSLRKWFYRPKKEDSSKLALFYWADEELAMVATELDSFDGRTDPERCSILVSQLRLCQDKVLGICNDIMDDAIPDKRANRDFRAKFPDDVLHENLAGQLWFGAECLAAGSNIIHRETESASMRPLAKALTRALDNVRYLLREQTLRNVLNYSDKVKEALRIFDRLFAEFELCYVSAMVPIKSVKEYHLQQEIVVLFSETMIRALKLELVNQDMIDDYDPSLMFTIPRLAIVWGLLLYPDGPFNVERDSSDLSELFRPFCNLLFKIRDLLWTLTDTELHTLEKMLCSLEEPKIEEKTNATEDTQINNPEDYMYKCYQKHLNCKQFIHDFYAYNFGILVPESGIPEADETVHNNAERRITYTKRSHKNQNNNNPEYRNGSRQRKTTDATESDVETLVSGNFRVTDSDEILGSVQQQNRNDTHHDLVTKDCDDKELRTSIQNSNHLQPHMMLNHCRSMSKHSTSENCAYCLSVNENAYIGHHASSLESRLSRLHEDCTCSVSNMSRERLTPSRELMRQVMRRVEIVPPGQQIPSYNSSPEGSPRAYHHGLLSHSFPTHPQHLAGSHSGTSGSQRVKKMSRHRSIRNRIVGSEHESSPLRCYYPSDYNSNSYSDIREPWISNPTYTLPLPIPRVEHLRQEDDTYVISEATYSSCSSCQSISSVSSPDWDSTSPDTSSYNSDCQDDEEIALALQAAEIASRNKARAKFKSSHDLLHKLFVCISGVADQLQTNYASDLRNILKSVFDMNCSQIPAIEAYDTLPSDAVDQQTEPSFESNLQFDSRDVSSVSISSDSREDDDRDRSSVDSAEEALPDGSPTPSLVISEENENTRIERNIPTGPPKWMPDELSSQCMDCKIQFTILRRRHHCRNCGKIFCSRCSSNSIPLPRFGHLKPVRVCNQCFMYVLTNLVMQQGRL